MTNPVPVAPPPIPSAPLVRLLQDAAEVEVVGSATEGATALALARQLQPGVVVLDARTAQPNGMVLIRHLRLLAQAPRIVVLSVYTTVREQALAAGACRFLLKDCSRAALVTAIWLAAQGHCQSLGQDYATPDAVHHWPGEPAAGPDPHKGVLP